MVQLKPVLTSPLHDALLSLGAADLRAAQEGEAWTWKGPEAEQLGLEPRTGVGDPSTGPLL